jgi:hypothetical protein
MPQAALRWNEAHQLFSMRPDKGAEGRTIFPAPRGAYPEAPHGPLQRLLGGVQDRAPYRLWQSDLNERALGIQIVAT